ncbi:MAG: hypothetical protein EA427_17275 [Spirochaetaceae bacterium]|nr:MAG: hypothetical protein EA427_17275 [Spirochaetaceae bacterium]
MASSRVVVGEGSRETVSFYFARPVAPEAPVVAEPGIVTDTAHGREMMAEALARLEQERRALSATTPVTFMTMGTRVSVPVAEELFIASGEYPDPEAIRESALENARIAAELQIGIGRRLLADREYEEGVLSRIFREQHSWYRWPSVRSHRS